MNANGLCICIVFFRHDVSYRHGYARRFLEKGKILPWAPSLIYLPRMTAMSSRSTSTTFPRGPPMRPSTSRARFG